MNDKLHSLLAELEEFGRSNDAAHSEYSERMLNITHDTGEFLSLLVRATGARRVLELGTSNGYSTLWLAEAVNEISGSVTSIDFSESKTQLAAANFVRANLSQVVTLICDEAGVVLERLEHDAFDFIFLDSERSEYTRWWRDMRRVLRPGGLLVADNATSHHDQMAPLIARVRADAEFRTSVVPVGNGEFLAARRPR